MRLLTSSIIVALALTACTNMTKANEQYRQALTLLQGGTAEAMQRGRDALELAANYGSPDATLTLGYYHLKGEAGFAVDAKKALDLFVQAAKAGNTDAAYNAGLAYVRGNGTEVNLKKAHEMFLQAARSGDAAAMYNLGLMSLKGEGTTVSPLMATVWFTLAAEQRYEGAREAMQGAKEAMTSEESAMFTQTLEEMRATITIPAESASADEVNVEAPL